jgi:very-short-patch-repair endonuclease
MSVPKALSTGEELFAQHCACYNLNPVRELQFHAGRKYRLDFAWGSRNIAVEIDGGTASGKSRHSKGKGYEEDCRKLNLAASLGWRVFRFTTAMVVSGEAIDTIREVLA